MNWKVQILIDNINSWMNPYAHKFVNELIKMGHNAVLIHSHEEVEKGDILFLLACEKKFKLLHLNKFNLVVHESDLPKGRGMSPFTWQIIEGSNDIVVSLLEASDEIDAGVVYDKYKVKLIGNELVEDWRKLQAEASSTLIKKFVSNYPNNIGVEQIGEVSYYRRRTKDDSKFDPDKTLRDQFNLLRVVDNERYPAWFEMHGEQYEIKITKKIK